MTIAGTPTRTQRDIADALRSLTALSMSLDDQIEFIHARARDHGGMVKLPQRGNTWDTQRLEISLHTVFAEGADWPEAIRNWQRIARTMISGGTPA